MTELSWAMALSDPMKRKRRRTNQQTRMAATGFELMVPLVTKPRMGPNRTSLATACSTREAPIRLFRQGLKVVRRMPMVMMGFQKAKSWKRHKRRKFQLWVLESKGETRLQKKKIKLTKGSELTAYAECRNLENPFTRLLSVAE